MESSHHSNADELIGRVLSERYRIERLLGQGGIGRVYVARHLTLGRQVALKVLLGRYEQVDVLKQRFAREAEALAALSHPNIVTVTDYGVDGDLPYIVMELLEGQDLAAVIDQPEPLAPKRVLELVRQALRALSYAHDRGLVHRDLKPHNIFVRDLGHGQEHVFVLDFGLARFVDDHKASRGPKLTRQGALIGTPAYMAPEQASGEEVDPRADLYAMGCVLYEALTGRRPFPMSDPGQLLRAHLLNPPPSVSQGDPGLRCSAALEAFVARALEKSPDARFASAPVMLEALEELRPSDCERIGPRPPPGDVSAIAPTYAGPDSATRGARPSAKREEPVVSAPSVSLPKNRAPLFAALGCAAVLGLAMAGAAAMVLFGESDADENAADTPDVPPPVEPPSPVVAPATVEPEPEVAPPPLAGDLPEPLQEAMRLRARRAFSRAERVLDAYGRDTDDTLGAMRYQLLRGHVEADQRHITEAVGRYETAYLEDARALGDPELPVRLMEAVCVDNNRTAARAADLIVRWYGADAAPAVRAAAAGPDREFQCTSPENLARLADRLEALR